ncbi:nucleolysin tiar [Hordeum vulgare]|nr:nucleolysin tiar [Hordeum vulgare]
MAFLVGTIQGMEKNISEILQNQESLERIVQTKFHDLNVKVTEIFASVEQLKHEVDGVKSPKSTSDDEESPPRTTTQFSTQLRLGVVPVTEARPSSPAQASAPLASALAPALLVSTPPTPGNSSEAFVDTLLSSPSSTATGDRAHRDD